MARLFTGGVLILASHNAKKLDELKALLAGSGVEIRGAAALGLAEPEETAPDFAGNAAIKAHAAASATGLPALADDSGLVAHGLDGAPGIRSARWAGPEKDYAMAMRKVTDGLAQRFGGFEAADRRAAFVTVLCLAWPDGEERFFEGRVEGRLIETPRGENGFGYDPIFVPEGESRSFAELTQAEKAALSHRGRAMRAMRDACFGGTPSIA